MSTARKHLGCAVYQDFIYAVGGRDDTTELNSVERYSDKGYFVKFKNIENNIKILRQLLEACCCDANKAFWCWSCRCRRSAVSCGWIWWCQLLEGTVFFIPYKSPNETFCLILWFLFSILTGLGRLGFEKKEYDYKIFEFCSGTEISTIQKWRFQDLPVDISR